MSLRLRRQKGDVFCLKTPSGLRLCSVGARWPKYKRGTLVKWYSQGKKEVLGRQPVALFDTDPTWTGLGFGKRGSSTGDYIVRYFSQCFIVANLQRCGTSHGLLETEEPLENTFKSLLKCVHGFWRYYTFRKMGVRIRTPSEHWCPNFPVSICRVIYQPWFCLSPVH